MQGLNFFGGDPPRGTAFEQAYQAEATQEAARIVILSELWLDQAGTLESLDAILTGIIDQAMLDCNDCKSILVQIHSCAPKHANISDPNTCRQPAWLVLQTCSAHLSCRRFLQHALLHSCPGLLQRSGAASPGLPGEAQLSRFHRQPMKFPVLSQDGSPLRTGCLCISRPCSWHGAASFFDHQAIHSCHDLMDRV